MNKENQPTMTSETKGRPAGQSTPTAGLPPLTSAGKSADWHFDDFGHRLGFSGEKSSRRDQSSPFSIVKRFRNEMDRLFHDFFPASRSGDAERAAFWSPEIEVLEDKGRLMVRAALPGLNKDNVQVEVLGDRLVIQGERSEERERRGRRYQTEIVYGSFYREIPLPEGVDSSQASAVFKDGVLEVTMPAPKREEGRRLEIKNS